MPGTAAGQRQELLTGKRVLLATGSRAVELPFLPFDGERVVSAREALSFAAVPEHLVVIGAGYIGLELGSVWRRLGAQVTVVEMLAKPLPTMDGQAAEALLRVLKKQGMKFLLETGVKSGVVKDGKVRCLGCRTCRRAAACLRPGAGGGGAQAADGRPRAGRGRRGAGQRREGWYVDENYRTTAAGIYAIGDLIPGPMLAHKASEEGIVFAERLHGELSRVEYEYLPGVCYTWPEAAAVGKTEEELQQAGVAYAVGRFNFLANGRARCMDETDGFVKILAR